MNCKHMNFIANTKIARLMDDDNSEVITGFSAEIRIKCGECGLPFEFICVPGGYSPTQPMVNFDSTELRAPIKPSSDPVDQVNALLKK